MPESMVRKFMAEGMTRKAAEAAVARVTNAQKKRARAKRKRAAKKWRKR